MDHKFADSNAFLPSIISNPELDEAIKDETGFGEKYPLEKHFRDGDFDTIANFTIKDNIGISTLNTIERLSKLKGLTLFNCSRLTDVSSLKNLNNLTALSLDKVGITELPPLKLDCLSLHSMTRLKKYSVDYYKDLTQKDFKINNKDVVEMDIPELIKFDTTESDFLQSIRESVYFELKEENNKHTEFYAPPYIGWNPLKFLTGSSSEEIVYKGDFRKVSWIGLKGVEHLTNAMLDVINDNINLSNITFTDTYPDNLEKIQHITTIALCGCELTHSVRNYYVENLSFICCKFNFNLENVQGLHDCRSLIKLSVANFDVFRCKLEGIFLSVPQSLKTLSLYRLRVKEDLSNTDIQVKYSGGDDGKDLEDTLAELKYMYQDKLDDVNQVFLSCKEGLFKKVNEQRAKLQKAKNKAKAKEKEIAEADADEQAERIAEMLKTPGRREIIGLVLTPDNVDMDLNTCMNLRSLVVRDCLLPENDFRELLETISSLPFLRSLILENSPVSVIEGLNNLNTFEADGCEIEHIVTGSLTKCTTINLANNDLCEIAFIKKCKRLREIDCINNNLMEVPLHSNLCGIGLEGNKRLSKMSLLALIKFNRALDCDVELEDLKVVGVTKAAMGILKKSVHGFKFIIGKCLKSEEGDQHECYTRKDL